MTDNNLVKELPVVPLRGGVLFPGLTTTVSIGRRRSLAAAQVANENNGEILVLVQKNAEVESPNNDDLAEIGLLANVRDVLRTTHLGVQMLVELRYRVQFDGLSSTEPYLAGNYSELPEEIEAESGELIAESIAYLDEPTV